VARGGGGGGERRARAEAGAERPSAGAKRRAIKDLARRPVGDRISAETADCSAASTVARARARLGMAPAALRRVFFLLSAAIGASAISCVG